MIKLGKIKAAEMSIQKLLNSDLPVRESYKLSKIASRLVEELNTAEKIRVELVRKYGTPREKDRGFEVPSEKMQLFLEEYNQLLDVDVDIQIAKININNLDGAKLSPIDFNNLDFIFEGEV